MSSTRDDGRDRLAAIAAVLVGMGLCALSVTVAYRFGAMLGVTETDKEVLGYFGAAVILGKIILPFSLTAVWRQGRWILWLVLLGAAVVTVGYSLSSSYGYSAVQRTASSTASDKVEFKREQLADLPQARPAAAIEPLIKAERNRKELAKLSSELAIAKVREAAIASVEKADPLPGSEAQVQELADSTGRSPSFVRSFLSGWLSVAFEFLEWTMFLSASVLWFGRPIRDSPPPKAKEPIPVIPDIQITAPVAAPVPAPAPVVQMQPAAVAKPRVARAARVTLRSWIEDHIDSVSSTTPMSAYRAYAKESKTRRRTIAPEFKFSRVLAEVAQERGLLKETNAGRITYAKAA